MTDRRDRADEPPAAPEPIARDGVLLLPPTGPADPEVPARVGRLEALAAACGEGLSRVVLIDSETPPEWRASLRDFNALLASRALPQLAVRRLDPASKPAATLRAVFAEAAERAGEAAAGNPIRRRLLAAVAETAEPATPGGPPALARLQAQTPAAGPPPLYAVAPVIDPGLCTGCDACLRVCPGEVLTCVNDSETYSAYSTDPASCDACGLCVDMCSVSAIGLKTMTAPPPEIALEGFVCRACGVAVHRPARGSSGARPGPGGAEGPCSTEGPGDSEGLCDICARTRHFAKNFQVL